MGSTELEPHPIMLITFGWAAIAAMFSFSIAMVVWGRNGDNTLGY
jgi:cytochrome b6-f complex subunit 8